VDCNRCHADNKPAEEQVSRHPGHEDVKEGFSYIEQPQECVDGEEYEGKGIAKANGDRRRWNDIGNHPAFSSKVFSFPIPK
jgi:hypothetical protein